jgi:hypothetical protein
MQYSLSNRLSSNVSGIDPDARAYIAAVEAVLPGNSIETALPNASNPKRIISDFIKAEKGASRWVLHKRIFLPIYANAAASAIDVIGLNVGTFTGLGSVTHAAGYVQSDGLTGYFDMGVAPNAIGVTTSDAYLFALCKTAFAPSNARAVGARNTASQDFNLSTNSADTFRGAMMSNASQLIVSSSNAMTGIVTTSRKSGVRFVGRRSSGGYANLGSLTDADVGIVPTVNLFALAGNFLGVPGAFTTNQFGAYGVGLGLTNAQNEGFTLNLKKLYEGLTGLTLP